MRHLKLQNAVKAVALSALFLTMPLAAMAQRGGDCGYRDKGKMIEKMQQRLDLTDAQASQVKEIFETAKQSEPNCRELDSKKESRQCMKQKFGKVHQQIEGILNEKQKAEFAKVQQEHKNRWENKKAKLAERGDKS